MNEKKFVQYKNDPNGTKWEVADELGGFWNVLGDGGYHWDFPKSDYIICAPPERWKDVTAEFDMSLTGRFAALESQRITIELCGNVSGYRLRKVLVNLKAQLNEPSDWAFIVEKRED